MVRILKEFVQLPPALSNKGLHDSGLIRVKGSESGFGLSGLQRLRTSGSGFKAV